MIKKPKVKSGVVFSAAGQKKATRSGVVNVNVHDSRSGCLFLACGARNHSGFDLRFFDHLILIVVSNDTPRQSRVGVRSLSQRAQRERDLASESGYFTGASDFWMGGGSG